MPVGDSPGSLRRPRSPCLVVFRQMATGAQSRTSSIIASTPSYTLARIPHPSYLKRKNLPKIRFMWFRLMATCLSLLRASTLPRCTLSSIMSKCLKWAWSLRITCANSSATGRTRLRKASHQENRKTNQKARGGKRSHKVMADEGMTEWRCGGNICMLRIIRNMTAWSVISGHGGLTTVRLAPCSIASGSTCSSWY